MSASASNQTHVAIRDLLTAGVNGRSKAVVLGAGGCAPGDVLAVAIGMLREEQARSAALRAAVRPFIHEHSARWVDGRCRCTLCKEARAALTAPSEGESA